MPFLLGLVGKVVALLSLGLTSRVATPPSTGSKSTEAMLLLLGVIGTVAMHSLQLYLTCHIHRYRSHVQFTGTIKHRGCTFSLGLTWTKATLPSLGLTDAESIAVF